MALRRSGIGAFSALKNPGSKFLSSLSTADLYPELKLKRKPHFSRITDDDIKRFRRILNNEPGRLVTDADLLEDYNVDWMRTCRGLSSLALLPKTTKEVSDILKYCNDRKLAVCPRGGNTGLVGGSVPVFDEIVLSLRLMNKVISIEKTSGIATCEAGVILDNLDQEVQKHGFTVPLDLGARHSCQLGGNISTNAGGIRLIRYGSLRANVLGLEFVLPNGQVVDCLSKMRKDNTGFDLKSLVVGAEGTLGVVTKVALLCPPKPLSVNVCLIAVNSFDDVLKLFRLSREVLSEILSAFEFFDSDARDAVEQNLNRKIPFQGQTPFYVLLETSGSKQEHDFEKLELLTMEMLDQGLCGENDIVLASDMTQQKELWDCREDIALALGQDGYVYKFDVSLPQKYFPEIHKAVRQRVEVLNNNVRVVSYGHVGDGNLHLNVTTPSYDPKVMAALDPFVFQFVSSKGGSVSAEHGLGLRKRRYITYSKSVAAVDLMNQMKRTFDPNGIMNPYKTIDPDLS